MTVPNSAEARAQPMPKRPGEKGYAAYWRRVVSYSRLRTVKGQPEGVSGRTLLAVLKTYGEHINNLTGEAWPSQATLAEESGCGKRTVVRAQALAHRVGFLEQVAPAIPRVRGTHVRATVPGAWQTLAERLNSVPVAPEGGADSEGESVPADAYSVPVATGLGATTGTRTLKKLSPQLSEPATSWPTNSQDNCSGENPGGSRTVLYRDPLTPEQRAGLDRVWGEAEAAIAAEAAAKLARYESINSVERDILLQRQPELLAPSFG
ncbi:helix-turn-helix domain-containing protein [Micromonospora coxensis]|uniref:helix-turn-helix domain-containing protein n=1 Tax=Micromonospora coxensis TaxID=356852 RepID=UPI00341F35A7